jgi:hypothetical protein
MNNQRVGQGSMLLSYRLWKNQDSFISSQPKTQLRGQLANLTTLFVLMFTIFYKIIYVSVKNKFKEKSLV